MKKIIVWIIPIFLLIACSNEPKESTETEASFDYDSFANVFNNDEANRFADFRVMAYDATSIAKLSKKQKELVYYLSEAALCGREIIYAQNYRHNLQIKRALEAIYTNYSGQREGDQWNSFETYLKRIWFANGIHHHYGEKKFDPGMDADYLDELIAGCKDVEWPLGNGETADQMWAKLKPVIFDPKIDAKKVAKDKGIDKLLLSANNYYSPDVTEAEAMAYYSAMSSGEEEHPVEYGLNSRLVRKDGQLVERLYKVGGLYSAAIEKMVFYLEKAAGVAENESQAKHINMLIDYFKTGHLGQWDKTNVQWVNSTEGDIDFILGFIEVYGDPLSYKAAFEGVVEINDFEASERMKVMSQNAQWFEDHSPIQDEHKKSKVSGVSYKVVNVAMESGAAAPSTPIGINLPNSNWIRSEIGSKSVSLGNIVEAYNAASSGSTTKEFYLDEEVQARIKDHGKMASKLHTAMHEVIGHASGKLNPGIGTPKETLQNYSNTLEEARADLVALYYILDQKLVDLGLMPSLDVGKAEYDTYITNGLFLQLRRLEPGDNVEEDHMRNRQLVAKWCMEKGAADKVIERKTVEGKTYFVVNDYDKLRTLFGELLREIQRIKSEGDFKSAEALVENYGVKADQDLLKEARDRYASLNLAPYVGFVQPKLVAEFDDNGNFVDLRVEAETYIEQMLRYSKAYAFLPIE